MLFSYATARSYNTSQKVTKGLNAEIPLIVYNGVFVRDNVTGNIMLSNYFQEDIQDVIDDLLHHQVYPVVYTSINNEEKMLYIQNKCTEGMRTYLESRDGDPRLQPIKDKELLYQGDIFYITCIDNKEKLQPLYEKYQNQYHCVFQEDMYTKTQWLELMPKDASKANAIQQLKEYLKCDRVVAFGDGVNDLDMFQMADECYAVANADESLKAIATSVIGDHNDDGVAKWLKENYHKIYK